MKNVQVIDGAENCTFPVFEFTDEQFLMVFPGKGQDIAFADDLEELLSDAELMRAFDGVWDRPVNKQKMQGLHGTLFYEFHEKKHYFPDTRRECDWYNGALNDAQIRLNAARRQQFVE